MRFPGNVVTEIDTRSGEGGKGRPEKCFYCSGKTGQAHDHDCVVLHRPVKIRMTLDMIVAAPREWSENELNDYWNNAICLDQFMDEIWRYATDEPEGGMCLCNIARVEYLRDADIGEAIVHGLIPDSEEDGVALGEEGPEDYDDVCNDCREKEAEADKPN